MNKYVEDVEDTEKWDDDFVFEGDSKAFPAKEKPKAEKKAMEHTSDSAVSAAAEALSSTASKPEGETWDDDFIFEEDHTNLLGRPKSFVKTKVAAIDSKEKARTDKTVVDKSKTEKKRGHQRSGSDLDLANTESTMQENTVSSSNESYNYRRIFFAEEGKLLGESELRQSFQDLRNSISSDPDALLNVGFDDILDTLPYVGFDNLSDDDALQKEAGKDFDDDDHISQFKQQLEEYEVSRLAIKAGDVDHNHRSKGDTPSSPRLARGTALSSRAGQQTGLSRGHSFNPHEKDPALSQSFHSVSNAHTKMSGVDDVDMNFDVEDWDSELNIDNSDYDLHDSNGPTMSLLKENLPKDVPNEESLLEFLEACVHQSISQGIASMNERVDDLETLDLRGLHAVGIEKPPNPGSSLDIIPRNSSSFYIPQGIGTSMNKSFYEQEENKFLESANQHLKGLFEWIDATSTNIKSVITESNSTATVNGQISLEKEVVSTQIDISPMLDVCEEQPTRESCIQSLEMIVYWMRGVASQVKEHERHPNLRFATERFHNVPDQLEHNSSFFGTISGKFGDESSIHGLSAANLKNTSGASRASTFRDANSNTAGSRFGRSGNNTSGFSVGPGAVPTTGTADNIKIITQRSFDRIFSRCDYILSEQTRYTTSRVLEIHTILAMQLSIDDYISRATVNGNVALDVAFHNAAVDATAATLSDEYTRSNVVQMMNLLANHISLCRIQIHMLEIKIHMYRSAFDLFGTLEKIQYISDELDAILNTWLKNLNFFLPSSQTIASLRNAENNNQWKKESKRVYSQDQAEILTKVIVDLQGLCVANKLLSVCGISPITYEEYTDIVTVGNLDDKTKSRDVQMLDKNLNTKNKSKYFGLVRINSKYMRSSYDEIDYDEVDTDNKTLQMYNVFYELGIGNQFIDLMLLIPSPSITRSKLSFAAYEYLNKLKSDRLPWQKNSRYSLKSIKPTSPDGFSDFKSVGNPNVEAEFGIGSEEIDTTTGNEVMSVGEVESNILQSFSEAFGNLDDVRILQLLLYEASVDMYPPVKKAQENNSNRRAYSEQVFHTDATASTKFKSSVGRASNRNSKSVNGEDIPTTNMSGQLLAAVAAGVENVQSIFHNVPLSINLNHSLMETIKESLYDLQVHYIDDFDDITITYILRYELYNFSYNLFFNLANCIVDTSPISALDLYEQCIILLGHLNKSAEQYKLQKEVTILAVKLEKQDSAIFHGKAVLEVLKRQDDAVNELLYITDLLIDQYCENSQYELAIKLIFEIVQKFVVSNKNMSKGKKSQVRAESVMQKLECQRATDKLLLKLSQIFLHYGCSDKSVDVLQLMLSSYSERTDSLVNDQSKITIISWLIEAYLAMEDFDACNKLVRTIKDIRIDKIFASLENPTTTATITNSRPASWRMFNAASDSQTVFIPHKALSSGLAVPNRCTLTGRDGGYTPFIRTRSVRSGISTRSFDKSSLYTVEPDKMSIGGDRFDDQFLNEVGLINYQMNTLDSNLPKFCVTSHNTDLGHITARIYFKSKLYIPALKSLTPTIIGVELVVGGKNGSKEGMLELGNLYFLRGQIQLEASKSVSEIRYPFDVGSSQLFSAIQLLSAEIRKNRRMQKIHRKFIRSDARNIPYLVRNDSVNSSFDHSNSKAGTTYSTTHHFFTCKRAITYSCPSDLLWDAMKWFRRAWDLFHAAGDEIWAARSANYIAKCHLEPTFVPHAFFQMPLDISCNLSVYVQDSRDAKDSSDWNPGSFAGIPSASSTGIASRQVVAAKLVDPKSDEDEGNRTISPSGSRNASAQMAFEHAHNQAALNAFIVNIDVENSLGIDDNRRDQLYAQQELGLHTLTQPRISNPKVTTSKRGKSSSASVLTRYASLEEVDRVMRFALDISVESCLPLLLIESHLNMAELYILQGNHFDAVAFWWESRELFLHLFADAALIPILRRATADFIHQVITLMNRLVRFLWVCDSSIVNQNLFLLEMHVLMTTEAERCIRHIQQRSRTMSKSLDVLLAKVLTSTDNIQTPKLSAHTLSSIQRTGVVEVAGEKGKSAHKKKTDMRSTNLDKTFHGTGSVEFPLQLFSGGRSMENMICLDDRQFYNAINDGVVLDRIYDFGWDQYVLHGIEKGRRSYDPIDKYHKIPPFLKDYILLRDNILGLDDSKDEEEENAPKTNLRSVSYDKINLSSRSYDRADLSCRSIDLGGFGSTSFDEYAGDSSRKKDYLSSTATNDNTVVPLDPYEDFRWMDANVAYTSYGLAFKWLSPSPKTDMPRGSQRSRPSIRPLMPELVENGSDASRNLLDDDEKDDDEDSDAGHYNLEEIKEIEKRSENILIQRIWRCFLVVENYQRHYQSQKYSLQMLRYGVRNALQNLSLFITRLRAFSRQYQGNITSYEDLTQILKSRQIDASQKVDLFKQINASKSSSTDHSQFVKIPPRHPTELSTSTTEGIGISSESIKSNSSSVSLQSIMLLQRLQHMVYVIHIGNLILMYRPASGTQHIQLFGGAGYIVYSNVFKSQPASGEVNLPTSPSKTGVATGGDRRTPPNPAGSSPVGGIPSLNEDRLAQHDSRFKNKRESIDNQSVGSGGWELKKTRTRDSLLISTNSDNSGTSSKSSSLPSVLDTDFQRRASFDFNIGVQKESLAQTVLRSTSFDENSRHTPTESQQPEVVENLSPPPHIQPTAHSTFQPYFESSLTTDDIMLLFDFSVKESDARCGGGCKSRKEQFDRMRNGILSYSLQFLKESAQSAIDKRNNRMSSIVEETYSPSNSEKSLRQGTPGTSPNTSPVRSQSGRNMDERSDNNSIQDSSENSNRRSIRRFFDGINQILKPAGAPESLINNISGNVDALSLVNCDSPQSQVTDLSLKRGSLPTRTDGINEAIHSNARMEIVENPPSEPVPLTIICSKSLQIVPWEILLTDVRLVRGMCLLSMCVHVLGPNNIVFEKSRNPDSASFGPSMRKSTLPISETNPLNNQKVHKIKGLLGPTKEQAPVYFLVSHKDLLTLPQQLLADLKSKDVNRRAISTVRGFVRMNHKSDTLIRFGDNVAYFNTSLVKFENLARQGKNESPSVEQYKKYCTIAEGYFNPNPFPCPSPLPTLLSTRYSTRNEHVTMASNGSLGTSALTSAPSTVSMSSNDEILYKNSYTKRKVVNTLREMEFLVMDLRDFKLSPSKFWDMYDNGIHFFGESPSKVAFTSPIKLAGAAVENGNTGNRRKDQSGGIHGRFDWSSPLNSRAAEKKHAESKTKESSPSLSTGTTSKINNFDIFTSRNHFPILLLSYVDLIEVSEVLTFLLMHRRDAVLIFAPHFIVDVIATGLKEGLDRWCKPDVIPKSVPVLQEDTVSSSVLRTMSMHKGAKAVNPQALESTRRARIQAKAAQSSEAVLKGPRADPFISRGVNPGGVVKNRELPPIPTLSLPDNTKTRRVDADNATSKNSGRISMSPSVDSSPTEGDWSIRQLSARLSGRQNSGKSKSWFDEWINTDENHASKMNDKKAKEEISAPLESNEMMNAASPNRVRSNSREKQSISRSSSFSISSKLKILRQRISKNPSNNLSEQSMESKLSDSSLINEHSSSGSVIDAINEEGQFLHDGIGDMKGRRGSDSAKLAHFKTDASLNGVPHSSIQVDSSANQAVDVYHVVMSVVAGLQEEYAVPIVVYNL